MKTTLAVANAKGGTAKTTTAVSLATGLAGMGYSTLLVDLDAQPGNCTSFLGLPRRPGLFNLLVAKRSPAECISSVPGYPKLGLVASDDETFNVNWHLASPMSKTAPQEALRLALDTLNGCRFVVLDCAPSLSHLMFAALGAADLLLVPTTPEFASEAGVGQVAQVVKALQEQGGDLRLLGVLPCMLDRRTKEHAKALAEMKETFGDLLYPAVGRTIRLGEAPRAGVAIWQHAPKSDAARDYSRVVRRFLEDMGEL